MKLADKSEARRVGESTTPACGRRRRQALRVSGQLMQIGLSGVSVMLVAACTTGTGRVANSTSDPALVDQGKQIFRFDTFGDESQWTDTLRMHEVIRTAVDPTTALSVGLKVDAEAPHSNVCTKTHFCIILSPELLFGNETIMKRKEIR